MSELEELEAIKRLKYKYLRCIDTKQWKELREVFTDDAVASYDSGRYSANGLDELIDFLLGTLERTDVASMHQVHCPELEITGETSARGIWYFHDFVVNPGPVSGGMPGHSVLQGAGFYDDQYVKQDGAWKIKQVGYQRTFELVTPFEEGPGVSLRSRWNS